MKRILALFMCILLLCGCTKKEESRQITVCATLFPQYDFCREIIGDKGTVKLILPPGMESHSFEPGVKDILEISKCDLFLYTGDEMEPWASSILDGIDSSTKIVDVSVNIDKCTNVHKNEEHHHGHEHSDGDPHIWTSPKNAKIMVQNILEQLIEIDGENKEYYIKNAEGYLKKLDGIDGQLNEFSKKASGITLCHGGKFSMAYISRDYNLNFIAAYDSCSEWAEPSALRVKEIIEVVRTHRLEAVFYEELSSGRVADTIANEAGVDKLILHTCHNLTKAELAAGETYVSLMTRNIENLNKAIGNKNA